MGGGPLGPPGLGTLQLLPALPRCRPARIRGGAAPGRLTDPPPPSGRRTESRSGRPSPARGGGFTSGRGAGPPQECRPEGKTETPNASAGPGARRGLSRCYGTGRAGAGRGRHSPAAGRRRPLTAPGRGCGAGWRRLRTVTAGGGMEGARAGRTAGLARAVLERARRRRAAGQAPASGAVSAAGQAPSGPVSAAGSGRGPGLGTG